MSKGFTLIELLVATGLFVMVTGLAAGVFVNSLRSQQAVVALMAANDNASLALEQMSREIRTGYQFSTNSQKTELQFLDQKLGKVTYRFNEDDGVIERNGLPLTSRNVKISYLFFDLLGALANDGQSTRVTIRLAVSAIDQGAKDIVTRLQTTVSSRQLDI
jgi:prepilin-type N-terminal cleavage/methylation domain-containing protein